MVPGTGFDPATPRSLIVKDYESHPLQLARRYSNRIARMRVLARCFLMDLKEAGALTRLSYRDDKPPLRMILFPHRYPGLEAPAFFGIPNFRLISHALETAGLLLRG